MNEASLTARLKQETELRLPPPVVFTKHHDGSTAGIADATVCAVGETWWVEVKYVRMKSSVAREVLRHPLQAAQMRLREMATNGRAVYLIFQQHEPKSFSTSLWSPISLNHVLESGIANPTPGIVSYTLSPWQAVSVMGGYAAQGLNYGLLAQAIREREGR